MQMKAKQRIYYSTYYQYHAHKSRLVDAMVCSCASYPIIQIVNFTCVAYSNLLDLLDWQTIHMS